MVQINNQVSFQTQLLTPKHQIPTDPHHKPHFLSLRILRHNHFHQRTQFQPKTVNFSVSITRISFLGRMDGNLSLNFQSECINNWLEFT